MYRIVKINNVWIIRLVLLVICILHMDITVSAYELDHNTFDSRDYYQSFYEDANVEEAARQLKSINHKYDGVEISFDELYQKLLNGKIDDVLREVFNALFDSFVYEIDSKHEDILKILMLIIFAAVFRNYSSIFHYSYIGEQGFYIAYMMLAIVLIQLFNAQYEIAVECVYYLKDIMVCIIPVLCTSMIICGGLSMANMTNTMIDTLLLVMQQILFQVILPGVKLYFFIVLMNQLNQKDRFSKLAEFVKDGIMLILKGFIACIMALDFMKALLTPIYDSAEYNLLQKSLHIIPGGKTFSDVSSILMGTGVIIKNSVGVAVIIILIVSLGVPLVRLLISYFIYKIILAVVQPVSEGRIMNGIQGAADSAMLLSKSVISAVALALLSIVILILTTNTRLYTG